MTIKIVIADDHTMMREGLSQALDSIPDIEVIASAADGRELLETLETVTPDVVLVDIEMPKLSGIGALRRLEGKPLAIVVTMHADDDQRRKAAAAGARGFLSKSAPLPDLAAAIRAVAAGEVIIEAESIPEILDMHRQPILDEGAAALTARERELLKLLASGVSSTEDLADQLYISQKTVKNHLASIYEKLAITDRAQAVVEAIRLGIHK
ncbi:MAG: response regulator transcription factor [Acidimicrobiia bacterium]|nr:response regulator transcription factor [Acidimicrobiia bacterium]